MVRSIKQRVDGSRTLPRVRELKQREEGGCKGGRRRTLPRVRELKPLLLVLVLVLLRRTLPRVRELKQEH